MKSLPTQAPGHSGALSPKATKSTLVGALALAILLGPQPSALSQTFKVLYSFTGGADGGQPHEGLIRDRDGNLYGSTPVGGDLNCGSIVYKGCGVLFKLDTTRKLTVLHTFSGPDGLGPSGRLLRNGMGVLYGTTGGGGSFSSGTAFKLDTTTGTFQVLYNFTGNGDGGGPEGLVADGAGHLYGTAAGGGAPDCFESPYCGMIFELDATGSENPLYAFTDGSDGAFPNPDLIRDAHGNLYGTAQIGGNDTSNFCSDPFLPGCGTVFKRDENGLFTTLYAFTGGADGNQPFAGVIRDSQGNLYGTTPTGGDPQCYCGVVFKVDPSGNETVLHTFTLSDRAGGTFPGTRLIRDKDGNLYGSAAGAGGRCGCGVVFELSPSANGNWIYTVLHTFTRSEGAYPASLALSAAGDLYGVAMPEAFTAKVQSSKSTGSKVCIGSASYAGGPVSRVIACVARATGEMLRRFFT